jgi:hypothetical protein
MVQIEHGGFRNAKGVVRHRRVFEVGEKQLLIRDRVEGAGSVAVCSRLHSPLKEVALWGTEAKVGPARLSFGTESGNLRVTMDGSSLATGFGKLQDGKMLAVSKSGPLPLEWCTDVRWD